MKYFDISEFDSPDLRGSGENMSKITLEMLDTAREYANIPFKISSGYRTTAHNQRVGGVEGSSHTLGYAADIVCNDSVSRFKIIKACLFAGFNRIGISKNFIHVDNDPNKSSDVVWLY